MPNGPAPEWQHVGNNDVLVSMLLPVATRRSWIQYFDEFDNVMKFKVRVKPFHGQHDRVEELQKSSPTLAFSKSGVLAALAAVTEMKASKLEDDSATDAMHKILGASLRNMGRHVSQAVLFIFLCFHILRCWCGPPLTGKLH